MFNLTYNANCLVDIVVRTPVGKTSSGSLKNFVLQGDVLAPLASLTDEIRFGIR